MKTYYITENITCGSIAAIKRAELLEVALIAVQGIAIRDLTSEERRQYERQISAFLFRVIAEDYETACTLVDKVLAR